MKLIKITTPRGVQVEVGSWANGKLGFQRKAKDGAVFSEYPARECTLKQALKHIESCYNTPHSKVTASAH